MRPPAFWTRSRTSPGILPRLLSPLSLLWKIATERRLRKGAWNKMPVPVICVGNLTVGGTGKTPVVCAVVSKLQDAGIDAHIVSRGYGGRETGPLHVNLARHDAANVGDEPMLLAAFAPTWVAEDRTKGIMAAVKAGAKMIIMDDGFQNPSVTKDLSIVVVDAYAGFGNGRIMPSGPLRETLATGLARADLLLTIGSPKAQERLGKEWPETQDHKRQYAQLQPLETGMDWQGQRVLAFAGIGRPEKFFATLKHTGADIVAKRSFPDHAEYSKTVLQRLEAEAKAAGAQLVTTEKDAVRLPAAFRAQVLVLPVRIVSEDWTILDDALAKLTPASEQATLD